jgi:hypothetical protein
MFSGKPEASVSKFYAGPCQMWDGQFAAPYEAAIINKDTVAEAAKAWAQTRERRDDALGL